MNPRVLELIKNPKNILSEDLGFLKEEIHAFPYIQNIRALHLYGVHLYEKENYQKELSITAAYTTDKKILYQLINGKIQQEVKQPEIAEEKPSVIAAEKPVKYNYNVKGFPIRRDETASVPEKDEVQEKEACVLQAAQEIKHLYVNGERNRILFEGEENFLDDKNPETIDLESTLESGTLVTQKSELEITEPVQPKEEMQQKAEGNAGENFTKETVINEDDIASQKVEEQVEDAENLSFQETESSSETEVAENIDEVPEEKDHVADNEVGDDKNLSFEETDSLSEAEVEENTAAVTEEDAEAIANEGIPADEVEKEIAKEPESELSFHGTEAFLPDVKIQANDKEAAEAPVLNINKHEDEIRRLIEEVEKKMKETKSVPQDEPVEPEAVEDHEISFAETQSFHFWSTSQEEALEPRDEKPEQEEAAESTEPEAESEREEVVEEAAPEVQTTWKPMSLESHVPDSLIKINKPAEITAPVADIPIVTETPAAEIKTEKIEAVQEPEPAIEIPKEDISPEEENEPSGNIEEAPESSEADPDKDGEAPVMNVSFFGTDISSLKVGEAKENKEEPVKEDPVEKVVAENISHAPINSNVPGFINTWQSWLKIDRTDEVEKEKAVIKEKAIDTFIENNPRISQLKEESTYVVKEKNDDISHLMTETLANLYFEQKLYSKAIKAFEVLIKKHPEKKEYFETRIKEIKDFRSKS